MHSKKENTRLSLDIPNPIYRRFKAMAGAQGLTMRDIMLDFLKTYTNPEALICNQSHVPNEETLKSIEDIEQGKGLTHTESLEDLFEKLGI